MLSHQMLGAARFCSLMPFCFLFCNGILVRLADFCGNIFCQSAFARVVFLSCSGSLTASASEV